MRLFICICGFLISQVGVAQFLGGNSDGDDVASYFNTTNIYSGGIGDGYDNSQFQNPSNIYAGGVKDGYATRVFENSISIFHGGPQDGYDQSPFTNQTNIFAAGTGDGYDLKAKILNFFWTGLVGTDWNTPGNWANGFVPGLNNNVIISSTASNFPAINAGIMSIGVNQNGGIFLCKNLTVNVGAKITFSPDGYLENYNALHIKGNVYMLNKSAGAIQNQNAGLITIYSGGSLQW